MKEAAQLDPLSRRLLRLAGLLSVLVILVALNAWLHGGEDNPFDPNPIAAAAERTQSVPGSRMSMVAVYSSPALPGGMTMSGSGAYDGRSGSSEATMTMRAPAPVGTVDFEMVGAGGLVYLRSSLFASSLPAGKEWLAVDPRVDGSSEATMAGSGDPRSQLEMPQAVTGGAFAVGRESVRGVMTTRYRGTIDLASFADFLRDEGQADAADAYQEMAAKVSADGSVEAWIDSKGLLRQMRVVMTTSSGSEAPAMTMDMRIEFFDFGARPEVQVPPASAVQTVAAPG